MVNLQDYINDSRHFKTIKVNDLMFVEYKCLISEEQSDIWNHNNYFAYVLGGRKGWQTTDKEYLVGSEEALFVKKGAHTVYQYFEAPFLVLFVFIPDESIKQIISKYPHLLNSGRRAAIEVSDIVPIAVNQVLNTYFQSLLTYFDSPQAPSTDLLYLKMEELILTILSQPSNPELKKIITKIGQKQSYDLQSIMEANFKYPLSLNEFARLSARSLSTFRRDFKKAYQTTPSKWLIKKRLTLSKLLLNTSEKPINQIVDECGFKNRSHFIKAFKQEFGIPPHRFKIMN